MKVIKRNKIEQDLSFDRITKRLGITDDNIDIQLISKKVINLLYDKITTIEIDNIIIKTLESYFQYDLIYQEIAKKILISKIYKSSSKKFSSFFKTMKNVDQKYLDFVSENKQYLDELIDNKNNYLCNYFDIKKYLDKKYLVQTDKYLESIQYMFLRISIYQSFDLDKIKNYYHYFSHLKIIPSEKMFKNVGNNTMTINLLKHVKNDSMLTFDYDSLKDTILQLATIMNDKFELNMDNISDLFALFRFPWDSHDAKNLHNNIIKMIYFILTREILKLKYNYKTVEHRIINYDEFNIMNNLLMNKIKNHSNFKPYNDFYFNKYLIRDLKFYGLWDKKMMKKIKRYNGSIQHIKQIPTNVKKIYKTRKELSKDIVQNLAIDRQKYTKEFVMQTTVNDKTIELFFLQ